MEVPPPPPPDEEVTYDLAPDQPPAARVQIKTDVVGAGAGPQRVLAYQNPGTHAAERIEEYNPRQRDYYLPISLIIVGALIVFIRLCWGATTPRQIAVALGQVGIHFAWEILVTLVAIVVSAKLLDISFGTIGLAILKLGALAIGPLGLWYLIWLAVPSDSGGVVGYLLSVPLYWWLFSYLFELDFRETLICVTIATLFRWLSYFMLWKIM
jgi:hypothetical protein